MSNFEILRIGRKGCYYCLTKLRTHVRYLDFASFEGMEKTSASGTLNEKSYYSTNLTIEGCKTSRKLDPNTCKLRTPPYGLGLGPVR